MASPRKVKTARTLAASPGHDVACYIRVSSASQSYDLQRAALERVLEAQKAGDVWWVTETVSGRSLDRPMLAQLRRDVRAGYIRKVFVYRLDRLTRSGIRDTLDVVHEFERAGCELVTIADGFDVRGPARDVVLAVLAWAAQMEREAIGERIRAARERVEKQGGAWGRPRRFVDVKVARTMHKSGKTLRQIAAALKVPLATLQRRLKAA